MTQSDIINNNFSKAFECIKCSNGYETGASSSEEKLFKQISERKRSTFDLSKFNVVGSPTITDDGVLLSTSRNNYFYVTDFNSPLPNKLTINFKVRTPATLPVSHTWVVFLLRNSEDNNVRIVSRIDANTQNWYFGYKNSDNTYNIKKFTDILANTLYDITIDVDGSNITFKVNGEEFFNGNNLKIDTNVRQLCVGSNFNGDQYWENFDLKTVNYSIDGIPVFSGNKTGLDVIKPDNYTVVGSPVISDDGVASGFSSGNYIKTSTTDFSKPFVIHSSFTLDSNATTAPADNYIFSTHSSRYFSLAVMPSLKIRARLGNGSSWTEYATTYICEVGKKYYTKLVYDGTVFYIYISTDNINFSLILTKQLDITYPTNETIAIGIFSVLQAGEMYGSIDLNDFKIYVDGNLVYQPCLKIPYTQSKTGSKIVDSVYRDRVIDLYEQEGQASYYTIQENRKENFTKVGSPVISDNGVASGFDSANANNIQIPTAIISQIATANTWKVGVSGTVQESGYTYSNVRTDNIVRYDLIQINRTANGFFFVCCLDKNGTVETKNIPIVFSNTYNGKAYKATLEFTGTKYIATVQFEDGEVLTNSLDSTYKIKFFNYGDKFELGYMCINGSIDLNSFKIYVDDKLVYTPFIEPNFTLPMGEMYGMIENKQNDVKKLTGYSTTGTLVLKSVDGVIQWVSE